MDERAAELAGRMDGDLERVGQPIGRVDPLIAAIAPRHERSLITGTVRHYGRLVTLGYGLRLEDGRGTG